MDNYIAYCRIHGPVDLTVHRGHQSIHFARRMKFKITSIEEVNLAPCISKYSNVMAQKHSQSHVTPHIVIRHEELLILFLCPGSKTLHISNKKPTGKPTHRRYYIRLHIQLHLAMGAKVHTLTIGTFTFAIIFLYVSKHVSHASYIITIHFSF